MKITDIEAFKDAQLLAHIAVSHPGKNFPADAFWWAAMQALKAAYQEEAKKMSEQDHLDLSLRAGHKISHTPFPTREELMKRNSFPGPDENKYLNRMWGKRKE